MKINQGLSDKLRLSVIISGWYDVKILANSDRFRGQRIGSHLFGKCKTKYVSLE